MCDLYYNFNDIRLGVFDHFVVWLFWIWQDHFNQAFIAKSTRTQNCSHLE